MLASEMPSFVCQTVDHARAAKSRTRTGHFEGQFTLASNLGNGNGVPMFFDLLSLSVTSFSGYLDGERRSVDVVIGELQVHNIITGFRRLIRDFQGTVFVIFTLDFCFTWTLDRKR